MLLVSKQSIAPRSECARARWPIAWRARQAIFVQAAKVYPLFEIDRALAGRRERALPVVVRIERGGAYGIRNFAGLDHSGLRPGSRHSPDPYASTWMHVPQKNTGKIVRKCKRSQIVACPFRAIS